MIEVLNLAGGAFVIAVGVLAIVGALLSRFGVRTFISPSRIDQRPELLAIGAALVLAGIGLVGNGGAGGLWGGAALDLSVMTLCVVGFVLQARSWRNRSKIGK
jgi:hypothetical protein